MIVLNKIYQEDCLATIERMDNNFLDLIVTSPPYNVNLGNNKYNKTDYDIYNDNKEYQEYIDWLGVVFKAIFKKTKIGGRCVVNIGSGKNGSIPTNSDLIQKMKDIGWKVFTQIIWDKNTTSARTAWGSWKSPSSPSFPTPFEYILVFYKGERKLQWRGETDLTKEEFTTWSLAKWTFSTASVKKIGHPAPFPLELSNRCIKMFSWIGSVVYDPFMGSGTTAVSCKNLHRNYIGSEISKEYCEIAKERLKIS